MSFFSKIQILNSLKALINPATEDTLALIKAKTDNIDVALSTRTKPADQQHTIVDSSALPTWAATSAKQLADNHQVTVSNMIPAVETGLATSVKQTDWTQKNQIVDSDGSICTVHDGSITTQTYLQAIAEWIIIWHSVFSKIWFHPATTAARTTLWNLWTEYVFSTWTISVEAVSTSVNDTLLWSGAKTCHLIYLDINYEEKQFTFNMNGVTPVAWPTDFFRVNTFHIETWTYSAWVISLRLVWWAATVYSQMSVNSTRSRNSIYTVPLWKTVYIQDILLTAAYSTAWKSERITLYASKTPDWIVSTTWLLFYPQFEAMIVDWTATYTKSAPIIFDEKTDIKVSVIWETNAQCTSEISGWIE